MRVTFSGDMSEIMLLLQNVAVNKDITINQCFTHDQLNDIGKSLKEGFALGLTQFDKTIDLED